VRVGQANILTLTAGATMVDTGAADHYIIDHRKTAFASDPFALTVTDPAIRQNSGFVKSDASAVHFFGNGNLFGMEEAPA
jgi:hypothetical protein